MKAIKMKICPCGSGKEYEKCCGEKDEKFDLSIPEDCVTGTPLDDYMLLFKAIMFHGYCIIKFDKEGKELSKKTKEFKKKFKPGTDTGIFDSMYMGWLYLDCRFGESGLTVLERLMQTDFYKKLEERGRQYLKNMANSYCAFYKVREVSDKWIDFIELGTERECRVHKINEDFEKNTKEGHTWYVRFIGIPEEGYALGTPYIFTTKETIELDKAMKIYKTKIGAKNRFAETEQEYFREYCREYMPHWTNFIVRRNEISIN